MLIPPHPLTNIKIQKYFQNESGFNGVYSRDKFSKQIKYGAYVINLEGYTDLGTHWIVVYVSNNDAICFDSFGFENILR